MDYRMIAGRVAGLKRCAVAEFRKRPARIGAYALVALALGVGVWSCQTSPSAVRRDHVERMPSAPDVRVRVKARVATVKLSGPAEFSVAPLSGKWVSMPGPLTVTPTMDGCVVTDGKGKFKAFAGLAGLDFSPVAAAGGVSRISVDGMSYPGRIRVVPRRGVLASAGTDPDAKLDVIEIVPIEEYVAGVIGAELFKTWPLGAYQVQAVCARTYALHQRERAGALGNDFDLESTTSDQAYLGGMQLPVAIQAAADTRGVVVSWEGRLLRAYYSSTCGGRTASAADIWPTGKGYEFNLAAPIQAHRREFLCQASTRYRWQTTRDRAQVSRQLREWGKANGSPVAKIGTLAGVKVDAVNIEGRPTKYILTDTQRRTYPIDCEQLRTAFNLNLDGYPKITMQTIASSSDLEVEFKGEAVTIRGRGFGHGVGMCQYCTKAFADRGDPWQQVVLRFYPGAKLERAF